MSYNTKEKKKAWSQRPEVKLKHREDSKKYRQMYPDKVRETNRKWERNNRDKCKIYTEKKKIKNPDYFIRYREKNKEILNEKNRERRKQGKLKESDAKHSSKRRKLGWNKLWYNPFSDEEKIVWHHIDDDNVIALPEDLHKLYYGKHHRENTNIFIEQIYGELYI